MTLDFNHFLIFGRYGGFMRHSLTRSSACSTLGSMGFTLMELSVVLVVVALIIGAIVVGKELLEVAAARRAMNELSGIEIAVKAFRLKYNCSPGDCLSATKMGLTGNGDGDGLIQLGTGGRLYTCGYDAYKNAYWGQSCTAPNSDRSTGESQYFWVHLSSARLISEAISSNYANPYTLEGFFKRFSSGTAKTYLLPFSWGGKTYIHTGLSSLNTTLSHPSFPTPSLKGNHVIYLTAKLNYPIVPNPGCTGYGSCTYPPALSQGQRVIATALWSTIPQAIYWPPNLANSTYVPCVRTVSGTPVYDPAGDCHLLWQID